MISDTKSIDRKSCNCSTIECCLTIKLLEFYVNFFTTGYCTIKRPSVIGCGQHVRIVVVHWILLEYMYRGIVWIMSTYLSSFGYLTSWLGWFSIVFTFTKDFSLHFTTWHMYTRCSCTLVLENTQYKGMRLLLVLLQRLTVNCKHNKN